jgi:hypothetical protein
LILITGKTDDLMKIPFANIFKSHTKHIPGKVKKQLDIFFPNAKNIEWEVKNEICEAIFYLNDVEHIAKISKEGILLQYKKNLWPEELPDVIKITGLSFGEIMNGIIIHRGEEVLFEVIIRNEKLDRFEFVFKENGEKVSSYLL